MIITLETLPDFLFDLNPGDRVFLRGNLGAGKTTFAQALIRRQLKNSELPITSPTYTYYQKYGRNIYHFDLYRVDHIDDIVRIGAEEIFENPESICIIEWPEILGNTIEPTHIITLTEGENGRDILIQTSRSLHGQENSNL